MPFLYTAVAVIFLTLQFRFAELHAFFYTPQ
jgi:hypothetical protein